MTEVNDVFRSLAERRDIARYNDEYRDELSELRSELRSLAASHLLLAEIVKQHVIAAPRNPTTEK